METSFDSISETYNVYIIRLEIGKYIIGIKYLTVFCEESIKTPTVFFSFQINIERDLPSDEVLSDAVFTLSRNALCKGHILLLAML